MAAKASTSTRELRGSIEVAEESRDDGDGSHRMDHIVYNCIVYIGSQDGSHCVQLLELVLIYLVFTLKLHNTKELGPTTNYDLRWNKTTELSQ